VITNHEEGKGKPPWLFPKTGYPLGYPEPALQQKTEERERDLEDYSGVLCVVFVVSQAIMINQRQVGVTT